MLRRLAIFLCLLTVSAAQAAPDRSIRPQPRESHVPRTTDVPVFYTSGFRPTARRGSNSIRIAGRIQLVPVFYHASYRPTARPSRREQPVRTAAAVQTPPTRVAAGRQGRICGNRSIRGRSITPIPGKLRGCGLRNGVEVTEVAGVVLSRPAKMDCNTAKALNSWVENGVKPAVGRLGGGVRQINVIAHYSCRTRNNKPGAKISEHGRGKAVDISGITLNNGKTVTVLKGWNNRAERKLLRRMHKAACGPFGTVLGPDADRYHKDHFHFDTANHRSGPYCR